MHLKIAQLHVEGVQKLEQDHVKMVLDAMEQTLKQCCAHQTHAQVGTEMCPRRKAVSIFSNLAVWGTWTNYNTCSATCGGGIQERTRSCQYGPGCPGLDSETMTCSTNPCPGKHMVNCLLTSLYKNAFIYTVWSPWGDFESCSVTCGGGLQSRNRNC